MAVLCPIEFWGNEFGCGPHEVGAGRPIFSASRNAVAVSVRRLNRSDVAAALPPLGTGRRVCDVVNLFSYVAIGDAGSALASIHLLGWRSAFRNPWLTSPLVAADLPRGVVRTASGHDYQLRGSDDDVLTPGLVKHLEGALPALGLVDVYGC